MEDTFSRHGGLTLIPTSKCAQLANRVKLLLENPDEEQLKAAKHAIQTDIATPEYGYRANGEPYVRISNRHIYGHDCYLIASGPGTPEMLTELFIASRYVVGRYAGRFTLICSYLPLCRSDKDEGELELALLPHIMYLAQSASHGMLRHIIACDLHSPQAVMAAPIGVTMTEVSMVRPLLRSLIHDAVASYRNDKIVLMLPDEGAEKRFRWAIGQISNILGCPIPIVYGRKTRTNSRLSKLDSVYGDLESVPGSLVIGFDDEAATLSTLKQTAEEVKKSAGAQEFWGAAVHGVLCGEAPKILADPESPINRLYVTDTVPFESREETFSEPIKSGRLKIVSWDKELAKIIGRDNSGESIRGLR
jgi:phosphoribosylpyrophosphate synthetase